MARDLRRAVDIPLAGTVARKIHLSWQYQCIYFGNKGTQNKWGLEDRVSKEDGRVVSKRKRNTTNRRLGY